MNFFHRFCFTAWVGRTPSGYCSGLVKGEDVWINIAVTSCCISVGPRRVVAEASKKINLGEVGRCESWKGRANPLMDRKVIGAPNYLPIYLSIYLSIYVIKSIWPDLFWWFQPIWSIHIDLSICQSDLSTPSTLFIINRSNRSNLLVLSIHLYLSIWLSASLKTKQVCKIPSIFGTWQFQNGNNLRDVLQKWKVPCWADGLVPMCFAIFPL